MDIFKDKYGFMDRPGHSSFKAVMQRFEWVRAGGGHERNQSGFYGIKGVAVPVNKPGTRRYAVNWTDSNGNLWLFGGIGYDIAGRYGFLNDLWRYDTGKGQWTWVNGNCKGNQYGSYTIPGTEDFRAEPGGRHSALSWVDNRNNLWLFGGFGRDASGGYGHLNDLWKYNISNNTWTWMSGDSFKDRKTVYRTREVMNADNKPGAREGATGWVDNKNNLWLFGGYGYGHSYAQDDQGYLSDLWKYDVIGQRWIWKGGDLNVDQPGRYAACGVEDSFNKPGARYHAASWCDESGNFWLFGGDGYDTLFRAGYLNDLWKYDRTTGEWTWMNGEKLMNSCGSHGIRDMANNVNMPGARSEAVRWKDNNGNFWLFGGFGYDASGWTGYLNDLWQYSISAGQWTWIGGERSVNLHSSYGCRKRQKSPGPRSRYGAAGWRDNSNNFWLFGGFGYDASGNEGYLNDMWRFSPVQGSSPEKKNSPKKTLWLD